MLFKEMNMPLLFIAFIYLHQTFFYHFTHTHTYIRVSVDTRASTISYHKPDDEEGSETKVKRQS